MITFKYDSLIEDIIKDLKQLRKDCEGLAYLDMKKSKLESYLQHITSGNKINDFWIAYKTDSTELPLASIMLFNNTSPVCRIIYHFNELKFTSELTEKEKDKLDFCVIRYL